MNSKETLDDYLKRKIQPGFWYEIKDDEVNLIFDTVPEGETWTAIKIADRAEYQYFAKLLDGRTINLIGYELQAGAHCSAITIDLLYA